MERERGESLHQLTTTQVGQWSVLDGASMIVRHCKVYRALIL